MYCVLNCWPQVYCYSTCYSAASSCKMKVLWFKYHLFYIFLVKNVPPALFAFFQFQVASENVSSVWNPWVQLFVCENAALIVNLNQFFTSSWPDVLEKLPSELVGEWADFFVEGIYNLLLPLPISITGVCVCVDLILNVMALSLRNKFDSNCFSFTRW